MNAARQHLEHYRPSIPNTLALLPRMVMHPRTIARELLAEKSVYPSLVVVWDSRFWRRWSS
jgi:hypothetical protein